MTPARRHIGCELYMVLGLAAPIVLGALLCAAGLVVWVPTPERGSAGAVIGGCILALAAFFGASALVIARRVRADCESLGRQLTGLQTLEVPVLVSSAPKFVVPHGEFGFDDCAGAVTQACDSFRDAVDAELKVVQRSQKSARTKTQFLASMSHDLRAPLNSLLGFTDLLLQGVDGPINQGQAESLELIRQSGRELLQLLTDVLDAARVDVGKLEVHPAPTTLSHLVEQVEREISQHDPDLYERLSVDKPFRDAALVADDTQLVRAITGVVRYVGRSHENARVPVRIVWREGVAAVSLEVDELGVGIRDEDRERMFEPFRGSLAQSGRRIRGLGLALAVARATARKHEGDLVYEQRGLERGTFEFRLPVA